MAIIGVILVLSPLLAIILFSFRDTHRGVDLQCESDFAYALYAETHHRWRTFWILVPGWILALLVVIDNLNYFYAWGNYSPIFHMEYDLPESGEVTLCIAWVYLVIVSSWMIFNFVHIARVKRELNAQWRKIKEKSKK